MHTPLVSIIIPVYNGENHIRETLDSALSQSISNFEVIIVNDGSNDQSADIISEFLLDSRFHYIEQANAGVAEARNTGIRAAKGEYIALLDQDDIWKSEKLELQLNYFNQHPKCALVHSQIGFINDKGAHQTVMKKLMKFKENKNFDYDLFHHMFDDEIKKNMQEGKRLDAGKKGNLNYMIFDISNQG